MKIAVYDCVAGDALTEKYGSVGNSVIQWIKPHLPEATWIETHIAIGAAMPDPSDVDGIIISGSEKGVYDDTLWMQPLRDNLETMRSHGIPIFGICFGHQSWRMYSAAGRKRSIRVLSPEHARSTWADKQSPRMSRTRIR